MKRKPAVMPSLPPEPLDDVEGELRFKARRLAEEARNIASRLVALAAHIEAWQAEGGASGLSVNGLGELQSAGPLLDARCAEVAALYRVRQGMLAWAEHERGEQTP